MNSPWLSSEERIKIAVVTTLCLLGATAGTVLLYLDRTLSGRVGQGPALAMIERREASVRRKAAGSYLWTNATVLEELHRRDAIQTNADSSALIRFNDNTLLEVGENSLVVIDNLKDIEVGFMRGNLILRSATGEDKKISVDSQGAHKVETIRLKLLKPEPLARSWISGETRKEQEFAWKQAGASGGSYRLEISSERSFPPGKTRGIQTNDTAVKVPLGQGRYFWRVLAVGGDTSSSSETRQLRVVDSRPLTPTYPGDRQWIARWGSTRAMQFRWAVQPGIEPGDAKHLIEISSSPDFSTSTTVTAIAPAAGAAIIDPVQPGKWFWRIKSQYPDLLVTSRIEEFTINESKEVVLTQSYPAEGARIEPGREGVPFSWDSDAQSSGVRVEYQLEVLGADGKSVFIKQGAAMSAAWSQPKFGRYRWRVVAHLATQTVGQTPWRSFVIQQGTPSALLTPTDGQEIRYWTEPTLFQLKWSEDSLRAKEKLEYAVEFSKDAGFQKIESTVRSTQPVINIVQARVAPGKWFWRVSLLDARGAVIRSTDARSFVYDVYPLLKAPSVDVAKVPQSYNPLEDERKPVLAWSRVEQSKAYEVTLVQPGRDPASQGAVVFKKVVTDTRLEVDTRGLKPGEYRWQVRAIDEAQRPGEASPPLRLQVTLGEPLAAPEITTQEVQ